MFLHKIFGLYKHEAYKENEMITGKKSFLTRKFINALVMLTGEYLPRLLWGQDCYKSVDTQVSVHTEWGTSRFPTPGWALDHIVLTYGDVIT